MKRKLMVIGLDCAPPEIVFDRRAEFPVLNRLIAGGHYGKMRSSDPPITIPAWMVMATGKDAGRLGLYGFRHRNRLYLRQDVDRHSQSVKEPAVWDYHRRPGRAERPGQRPAELPAATSRREPHLLLHHARAPEKDYTYPAGLKAEIEEQIRALRVRRRLPDRGPRPDPARPSTT